MICQAVLAWCHLAVEVIALDAAITFATPVFDVAKTNAITTNDSLVLAEIKDTASMKGTRTV